MTNDEARKYFNDKGLNYDDINSGDVCILVMKCNQKMKLANKAEETSVNIHMSQKVDVKYRTNGKLRSLYLYVNSHYFKQREAISFNLDGFIGFAGWASSKNTKPLIDAFIEWVDYLVETKAMCA